MKKLGLVLIVALALAAVVAYLNPDLLRWVREQTGTGSESTTVYKWRDDQGEWHVTNEPPPPGTEYQEQEYLHDTNVLPPTEQDKK